MLARRNWLLRCSIIANLAVLVYIGMHIVVKSGPVEYSYEQAQIATAFTIKDQSRVFNQDQTKTVNLSSPVVFANASSPPLVVDNPDNDVDVVVDEVTSGLSVAQDETVLEVATLEVLRSIVNCQDKSFEPVTRQRGEFWVLHNFVKAEHGPLGCHETVTYTTHGDFTFMDNLVPLLEKFVLF